MIVRRHSPLLLLVALAGCSASRYYDQAQQYDKVLLDCPGMTAHAMVVDTFLVIGHRGAAAKAVENTIASMEVAVDRDSANAVEIDLSMTADGQVILWHDWDPNSPISLVREQGLEPNVRYRPVYALPGTGFRKPVDQISLADFRRHYGYALKDTLRAPTRVDAPIPTFEEFVRWAAQRPRLQYVFLDIKAPGEDTAVASRMISAMDAVLRRIPHSFRAVYMTPHQPVYDVIARLVQTANLSFDVDLPGGAVPDPCVINSASVAVRSRKGFASTVHPFTTTLLPWTTLKRLITCDVEMRDRNDPSGAPSPVEKVIAATINEPEKMECLIGIGVDGLITDDPQALRAVARRLAKRVDW
jgi:glycerophosphoryl diester phosphodiesterase